MLTIDRSPGQFIFWSNLVVYGVICTEIWMWGAASVLAVAFTLALIATIAGLICLWMTRVLDDASGDGVPAVVAATTPAAATVPVVPVAAPVAPAVLAVPSRRPVPAAPRTIAHV